MNFYDLIKQQNLGSLLLSGNFSKILSGSFSRLSGSLNYTHILISLYVNLESIIILFRLNITNLNIES